MNPLQVDTTHYQQLPLVLNPPPPRLIQLPVIRNFMQSNTSSYFRLWNPYSHSYYSLLKPTTSSKEISTAGQYHSLQILCHPLPAALNAPLTKATHFVWIITRYQRLAHTISTYMPTDMQNHALLPPGRFIEPVPHSHEICKQYQPVLLSSPRTAYTYSIIYYHPLPPLVHILLTTTSHHQKVITSSIKQPINIYCYLLTSDLSSFSY